jgi:GNAT superfamily N-acetyltransferase
MAEAQLTLSELDSKRFGIVVAWTKNIDAKQLQEAMHWCRQHDVRLLIARCPATDWQTVHALEKASFALMDTLVYYKRSVPGAAPQPCGTGVTIRQAKNTDAEPVAEVARLAFRGYQSHYHNDPLLPKQDCDEVYVDWARRSVRDKTVADVVLVAEVGERIIGFLSLRGACGKVADIPLNAVDPSYQRQGIYRTLLASAIEWCSENGFENCSVSTQLPNNAAQKVWVRMGFEPSHALYTFHRWFDCEGLDSAGHCGPAG